MDVLDEVRGAFSATLATESLEAGERVTLPIAMSGGNLVQLYVERFTDDLWFVTDEGQAASELALAGVNLETQKAAAKSWAELMRSVPIDPPLMRDDIGEFDIAGLVQSASLGPAILSMAEAVVRGEGLRALAPGFRARRFRDVIVQSAGRKDLPVLLDAPMPTRHGGQRAVSVKVIGSRTAYMQAVSGKGSQIDGFDKAQAVFTSAAVPKEELYAVLARRVQLEGWQWQTLSDFGTAITEDQLEAAMEALAA